jgi:hypothetical protein
VSAVGASAEVLTTECSEVLLVADLSGRDRDEMFALMDVVYEGVTRAAFERDLAGKDECIVLRKASGEVAGFSTQRFVSVEVDAARVAPLTGDERTTGTTTLAGLFSGDTVIHPDHWGTPVLFQTFARRGRRSRG